MQISFKPITLADKAAITAFTLPSDYKNCDFSFANMCSWRFLYDSCYAVVDGFLLIRFLIEDKSRFAYMTIVRLKSGKTSKSVVHRRTNFVPITMKLSAFSMAILPK